MKNEQTERDFIPAVSWNQSNTEIDLWHGCTPADATSIQNSGVKLMKSRYQLDFGRGFYTTTERRQAEEWSKLKQSSLSAQPVVLRFRVKLCRLAQLENLTFVRGDAENEPFWRFVHYCRNLTKEQTHCNPNRKYPKDWYDWVSGPIATRWPPKGRSTILNSDQFSFHTDAAIAILNEAIDKGQPLFEILQQ